ncbi:hypothetical protein ACFSOZ_04720 [Mesorhizobium newzealandense]|uniref:Uncharacterized protein n=1 Tax=Mesorhizobium newzealandense TaxID=1300302 RepID=A0ABW4U6E4_9HYPH
MALAIAPCQLAFHGAAPGILAASAHAKDGGHGGGSGSGGSGNSNSGNDGDVGNSKGHDDDGDHVNAATGDRVEVKGNKIEVEHPDGITEEIENGRFEMKDALGRTIVERPATADDISRLQAL